MLLIVLASQLTFAQERTVSGTISDHAGLPLPGGCNHSIKYDIKSLVG